MDSKEIIDLWQVYNRDLAVLIRHTDPKCLRHLWRSPEGTDVDLEFIIRDYLVHLRHHLDPSIEMTMHHVGASDPELVDGAEMKNA